MPASYSFRGNAQSSASGPTLAASIDLGTHASDFIVCAASFCQHDLPTVFTVGGAGLTDIVGFDDRSNSDYEVDIRYGLFSAADGGLQTVSATFGSGTFANRCFHVWTIDGLGASSPQSHVAGHANSGLSIDVKAGDFILALAIPWASPDFSSSTVAPDATHSPNSNYGVAADWAITADNPAFLVKATGGTTCVIAASFRPVAAGSSVLFRKSNSGIGGRIGARQMWN